MKVALVVDWLTVYSGAERVIEKIIELFPDADLFALVDFLSDSDRKLFGGKRAATSFLQKMPFAKSIYRHYLPLMPLAIEQFDLKSYDLIISSSHAVAKGVITGPGQVHICYIHSPIRYAWDLQSEYLREAGLINGIRNFFARIVLHYLRTFDVRSSFAVDYFVANSNFVADRVWKFYRRESKVIFPPVSVEQFTPTKIKGDYYITASRMVPYKRMDLVAAAFVEMPDRHLVIAGDGPEAKRIERLCKGSSNITILGHVEFSKLRKMMEEAKCFIFAAEEDFGIVPVEAMACGTPVIAFGRGGATETIIDGETGIFFPEQTVESIRSAVERFEMDGKVDSEKCRARAEQFSDRRFKSEFAALVAKAIETRSKGYMPYEDS